MRDICRVQCIGLELLAASRKLAAVLKGHFKVHSAKRIRRPITVLTFNALPSLTLKIGSRFHPSKPAVILSGFRV
jgi:hypothetical protein